MPALTDIIGRDAWLLFDLDVGGGRVYYFTDSPEAVTVTAVSGLTRVYVPGLITQRLTRKAGQSTSKTKIQIAGTALIDWSEVVARGASIHRAKGVLRRWYEGQPMESATLWARGFAMGPSYGALGEALTFSLERRLREGGVIPSANMIITAATWPVTAGHTVDDAAVGQSYPMVFGRPDGSSTPAYMIEYKPTSLSTCKLIIAGHRVEATTVILHDVASGVSGARAVQYMKDRLGRTIAYVDFSGYTFTPELNREYRIEWNVSGTGGLVDQGTIAMTGAGDIAGYLLRRWSDIDVDWGKMSGVLDELNSFKVGFSIVEPTEVWAWIRNTLLPLINAEVIETDLGIYIQPWNLSATAADSVGHINISPNQSTERIGPIKEVGGRIVNEFSLQYAFGGEQHRPQKQILLSAGVDAGGAPNLTDANARPNLWCHLSQLAFGVRRARPIVTDIVYDNATANLIVRNLALRHALPRRAVKVSGPLTLDRWALGATITVQADDLYWVAEPAQIREKSVLGNEVTLILLLLGPYGATAERRII